MSDSMEPVATVISGHTFTVDSRYVLTDSRILGKGSFGVVCTAYDSIRRLDIAIKRIRPYANDEWDAKHTLREIRLLRLLGLHPNVVSLYEMSLNEKKTELYMMMELMDCDLHRVIQSKQVLSEKHHKCFIKQILEAMRAMHSVGVFHRDLKPGNILVSKDCQLRIADFGLARFMDDDEAGQATDYVVTRWYRCPELLLTKNYAYSAAIDMWSVGCILAELLRRQPLFPGKSHTEQVQLIFQCFGYAPGQPLGFPISDEALVFLDKRCRNRPQSLRKYIPNASDEAMELVESLLTIDPARRPSAVDAMEFKFMAGAEILNDYSKQYVSAPSPNYFDFERNKYSVGQLKRMIEEEVFEIAANRYRMNGMNDESIRKLQQQQDAGSNLYGPQEVFSARGNKDSAQERVLHSSESHHQLPVHDPMDGPSSQAPTQNRNASRQPLNNNSSSNPYANSNKLASAYQNMPMHAHANQNTSTNNPYGTSASNRAQPPREESYQKRIHEEKKDDEDDEDRDERPRMSEDSASMAMDVAEEYSQPSQQEARRAIANVLQQQQHPQQSQPQYTSRGSEMDTDSGYQSNNLLTAVRNDIGPAATRGRKSTPKTPTPKKMDMIIQKDINNRQRFAQQQQQPPQQLHSSNPSIVHEARVYRASFPANEGNPYSAQNASSNNVIKRGNPFGNQSNNNNASSYPSDGVADDSANGSRRKVAAFPSLARITNAIAGRSSAGSSRSDVDRRINNALGGGGGGGGGRGGYDGIGGSAEPNRSAAMMHSGSNVIQNSFFDNMRAGSSYSRYL